MIYFCRYFCVNPSILTAHNKLYYVTVAIFRLCPESYVAQKAKD